MEKKSSLLIRCIICILSAGTRPIVVIRHIIVILKWPKKVLDRIAKPKEIQAKLTGNTNFPLPYPVNVVSLAQLGTDIIAVDTAQTNVRNGVKGAVQDRNAKMKIVKTDLESIKSMVQIKADSNPANAESMITGTGYDYKKVFIRQKQQLGVKRTAVSGSYMLIADGGGEHEWQISTDKINITNLPATSTAHTLVTDLTVKQTYYQRNRKVGKKGVVYDWSPWLEFIVT
jgi:hypothetical protein